MSNNFQVPILQENSLCPSKEKKLFLPHNLHDEWYPDG